jgi:hypothetical protein
MRTTILAAIASVLIPAAALAQINQPPIADAGLDQNI